MAHFEVWERLLNLRQVQKVRRWIQTVLHVIEVRRPAPAPLPPTGATRTPETALTDNSINRILCSQRMAGISCKESGAMPVLGLTRNTVQKHANARQMVSKYPSTLESRSVHKSYLKGQSVERVDSERVQGRVTFHRSPARQSQKIDHELPFFCKSRHPRHAARSGPAQ